MHTYRIIVVLAAILALCGCANAVQTRMRGGSREKALTSTGSEFRIIHDGRCSGTPGCTSIETAEDCTAAAKDLQGKKKVDSEEHTKLREGWERATGQLHSVEVPEAELLQAHDNDVCDPGNEISSAACETTPYGCSYMPHLRYKRVFFNSWKASKATEASKSQNSLCKCDEDADYAQHNSASPCGSYNLLGGQVDVIDLSPRDAGSVEERAARVDAEMTMVHLKCAYGHTFSGQSASACEVDLTCNILSHAKMIVETSTGKTLETVPLCKPNSCSLDALVPAEGPSHAGLWQAHMTMEAQGMTTLVHGEVLEGVLCSDGHSLDGKAVTLTNAAFTLDCNDGGLYPSLDHLEHSGASGGIEVSASTGEFTGAKCKPVQCPVVAKYFESDHKEWDWKSVYQQAENGYSFFSCSPGFVLCNDQGPDGPADTVGCPADKLVPHGSFHGLCTPAAMWQAFDDQSAHLKDGSAVTVDTLRCAPRACPVAKAGASTSAPSFEEEPRAYVYQHQKGKLNAEGGVAEHFTVTLTCTADHSLGGIWDGETTAELHCGVDGQLVFDGGKAPPDHCSPVGCKVLKAQHQHRFEPEIPTGAVQADHGSETVMSCAGVFSFDGKGVHEADYTWERSNSNVKRTLRCEKGLYQCVEGYCEGHAKDDFKAGTAFEEDCTEITCPFPTASSLLSTWHIAPSVTNNEAEQVAFVPDEKPKELTCAPGFVVEDTGICTYSSQCMQTWTGMEEKEQPLFQGWEAPLKACVQNKNYCPEANEEHLAKKNMQMPPSGQLRTIGAPRRLICKEGFTSDDDHPAKPTDQSQFCQSSEDPCSGEWKAPVVPCTPVTCRNPPASPAHSELTTDGAAKVQFDAVITYACEKGYRWTKNDDVDGAHAISKPADAETELTMKCNAQGRFTVSGPDGYVGSDMDNGVLAPRCVPVFCAAEDTNPFKYIESQLDQGAAAEKHKLELLDMAFTWGGPPRGWEGRLYSQKGPLTCNIGGLSYPMTCAEDGKYVVDYNDEKTGLLSVASDLLKHCGFQLRVKPTVRAISRVAEVEGLCLTAKGDAVTVATCDETQDEQLWWFERSGEQCTGELVASGQHNAWSHCGQLRSLEAREDSTTRCMAPPEEDAHRGVPKMVPCGAPGAVAHWLMDRTSGTLRLDHSDSDHFRKNLYLAAENQAPKGEVAQWGVALDAWFNRETEHGWATRSLSSGAVPVQ